MLLGWEGSRRSGVALAMHYRLNGIPANRLNGLGQRDDHLTCTQWTTAPSPLPVTCARRRERHLVMMIRTKLQIVIVIKLMIVKVSDICISVKFGSSDAWRSPFCNDNRSLWKDRTQARTYWSVSGSAEQVR